MCEWSLSRIVAMPQRGPGCSIVVGLALLTLFACSARAQAHEVARFVSANNLAAYLNESVTPLIYPTELNIVFVGFSGEGKSALNVSDSQLSLWFQQLRTIVPHVATPEDGRRASSSSHAAVQYSTRLRVHRLGPEVTQRLEQLLAGHLRPEGVAQPPPPTSISVSTAPPLFQMSAHTMSAVLASLRKALRLTGFTLFILNPQQPPSAAGIYGYRNGFSNEEVAKLRASEDMSRMMASAERVLSAYDDVHARQAPSLAESVKGPSKGTAKGRGKQHARERRLAGSRRTGSVEELGAEWAAGEAAELLSGVFQPEEGSILGRGTEDALLARVSAVLHDASTLGTTLGGGADEIGERQQLALAWHRLQIMAAVESMRGGTAAVSCLSDVWVSSLAPLAFVDLSAGPFEWGPANGGMGVRTLTTLPDLHGRVPAMVNAAAAATAATTAASVGRAAHSSTGRHGGGGDGAAAGDDAPTASRDKELAAERNLLNELMTQVCERAAATSRAIADAERPSEDNETPDEDGVAQLVTQASDEQEECNVLRARLDSLDAYMAELDEEAGRRLEAQAQVQTGAKEATPVQGMWMGPLLGRMEEEGVGPASAGARSLDKLLSQLGAAVSLLREHVVLPPSSTAGAVMDPAALATAGAPGSYAERVLFQLYIVSSHAAYASDGADGLSLEAFKRGLHTLRLPSQQFSIKTTRLSMADDAALAMAYTTSIRYATIPHASAQGNAVEAREVVYLDARQLARMLRQTAPPPPVAAAESLQTSRTIPIFFFSSDAELPLFIDHVHAARAVEGMVLAVQSSHTAVDSPVRCGGAHRTLNLRRPHREALAATAALLGGLIPPQRGAAAENWLWAVGDSPLSPLAGGVVFGEHEASVVHRHYVVSELNASAVRVQTALAALASIRTTPAVYKMLQLAGSGDGGAIGSLRGAEADDGSPPWMRMKTALAKAKQLQQRIVGLAARYDYDGACQLLHSLRRATESVSRLSDELVTRLARTRCTSGHSGEYDDVGLRSSWSVYVVVAVLLAGGAAMVALGCFRNRGPLLVQQLLGGAMPLARRRAPPKVNMD